ncbi:hypothetical protein PR048_008326 [Dryococelus australis]|uniref:Protein FAM207A n=1 Tax=Dryococelus australis TaxID=614101 RepID=A0ABQ9HX41_9NEOP|nr:hypothetical protein PR048_008326 [Dryococelus australis]
MTSLSAEQSLPAMAAEALMSNPAYVHPCYQRDPLVMGKLKRARQKFHLSRTKEVDSNSTDTLTNFQSSSSNSLSLNSIPENIFSGIEISFDDLKQKLPESDVKSIISSRHDISKKNLKKKEKIKLRHEMFVKKLEVVSQLRKEAKQKQKPKAKTQAPTVMREVKSLFDSLPSLEGLYRNKQPINKDKKSVPKIKKRQKMITSASVWTRYRPSSLGLSTLADGVMKCPAYPVLLGNQSS